MEKLLNRALRKYKEDGIRELSRATLRQLEKTIENKERKKKNIVSNYESENKYLNVGGGTFLRKNWRVLDYYTDWYDYDEIFIDYNVNLEEQNKWPIADGEFELVFSSHTLEHLSDSAVENTLSEIYRVLKPGGTIRINVPDIDIIKNKYENGNKEWFIDKRNRNPPSELYSSEHYMEEYFVASFASHLTNTKDNHTNKNCIDFSEVQEDYNSLPEYDFYQKYSNKIKDEWQNQSPGSHRNWFNKKRLEDLLSNAGFNNISQQRCQVSSILEFTYSEFNKRPYMSIFVEATK